MAEDRTIRRGSWPGVRFARTKFRAPMLPDTLVARPELYERLTSGAGKRLTLVVGTAGSGKSVLVSSWAAARPSGATSWLSCDEADADPVRFWAGFIEAARQTWPEFGAEAADLLMMDDAVSPDVIASIGDDAAGLPAGAVIIVDDFHAAEPAVSRNMAELVERWPGAAAQLVLASRSDPAVRLHRLRMSGDLCELRDDDLHFSLGETQHLLTQFGVDIEATDLALLHRRSEGWAAALQMAALSLRGTNDPARIARALDVGRHPLAEYFVSEVLEGQPAEVVQFMLETSVLDELTAAAGEAVTHRTDAAWMLRRIDAANLFVVAMDEERTAFRYHQLVDRVLRAELRARDRAHERVVQERAAEWFQSMGNTRRAARHLLAASQVDRALAVLRDGVVTDFLRDPALPAVPDLSTIPASALVAAPDQLLGLVADLLTSGHTADGGHYLDVLERAQPSLLLEASMFAARFAALRCLRFALEGRVDEALEAGFAARSIQAKSGVDSEFETSVPLVLLRVYTWLEDLDAVEREAAAVSALPSASEPVKGVLVPGAQALAWFEFGRLTAATEAATAAQNHAKASGFDRHFFAVDYLRTLAGLALEQRHGDTAERLIEQALSIAE
ncbi:MAG TPA: hypothetical protein VH502_03090, partial [Actinoplanes sp.]